MSSLPPPPPPGYVPTSPPPPPAEVRPPAKWIKPAYFVGLIAVVVAVAVVLVAVLTGDDEPSGPDTKAAAAVLQAFEDTTQLERDEFHSVDECFLGDVSGVVESAPGTLGVAIAEDDTPAFTTAAMGRPSDPWLHSCAFGDGADQVIVLASLAPPGEYHPWVERSVPDSKVTFDDDQRDGSATIVTYCIGFEGQDGEICEADWTDGVVSIGVSTGQQGVDHDLLREWVLAARDEILSLVAAADPAAVTESTFG